VNCPTSEPLDGLHELRRTKVVAMSRERHQPGVRAAGDAPRAVVLRERQEASEASRTHPVGLGFTLGPAAWVTEPFGFADLVRRVGAPGDHTLVTTLGRRDRPALRTPVAPTGGRVMQGANTEAAHAKYRRRARPWGCECVVAGAASVRNCHDQRCARSSLSTPSSSAGGRPWKPRSRGAGEPGSRRAEEPGSRAAAVSRRGGPHVRQAGRGAMPGVRSRW
jgi:hypothetical protein